MSFTDNLFSVEFYAPWCQTCQEFAPNFEAAARVLVRRGVFCAKVLRIMLNIFLFRKFYLYLFILFNIIHSGSMLSLIFGCEDWIVNMNAGRSKSS
jgi:thiol-disulfide isomerase/thioredoxin